MRRRQGLIMELKVELNFSWQSGWGMLYWTTVTYSKLWYCSHHDYEDRCDVPR